MEGSERTGPTEDGHGKTQQLSLPDQRCSVRSVRMWASERDSRAFSLPMYQVDGIPNGDAPMYRNTPRQHTFLPRREDTNG
jgi:hypothetical protein